MATTKQLDCTKIDWTVMNLVIETALAAIEASDSKQKKAWTTATNKAADALCNNPYWCFENNSLTFVSAEKIYEVARDGSHVGCQAYNNHAPCYHRAIRKLLDNYAQAMTYTADSRTLVADGDYLDSLREAAETQAIADEQEKQRCGGIIFEGAQPSTNAPKSHAPSIKQSPAKACLDAGAKRLEQESVYRHAPNMIAGERFGGMDI